MTIEAAGSRRPWTLLSNHGHVLVYLARHPDPVMREIAAGSASRSGRPRASCMTWPSTATSRSTGWGGATATPSTPHSRCATPTRPTTPWASCWRRSRSRCPERRRRHRVTATVGSRAEAPKSSVGSSSTVTCRTPRTTSPGCTVPTLARMCMGPGCPPARRSSTRADPRPQTWWRAWPAASIPAPCPGSGRRRRRPLPATRRRAAGRTPRRPPVAADRRGRGLPAPPGSRRPDPPTRRPRTQDRRHGGHEPQSSALLAHAVLQEVQQRLGVLRGQRPHRVEPSLDRHPGPGDGERRGSQVAGDVGDSRAKSGGAVGQPPGG